MLETINAGNTENRIKLRIPFISNSPLRSSEHPYVIFDTPGSNAANHEDHLLVLQEALHGMSNGLMLYLTLNTQQDTNDNKEFSEKISSIHEIDKRFTMVIINHADDADFDKYDPKDIKSPIIDALDPSGIYFVSSVMALGAKNNGKFVKQNNARTYKNNKNDYLKNDDDENAQRLYIYDIAPRQLVIAAEKDAQRFFGSAGDDERILVNSGLWHIEQKIKKFGDTYAPYNKCSQSLLYLRKVEKEAKDDMAKAIVEYENSKANYQREFNDVKDKLFNSLLHEKEVFYNKTKDKYKAKMAADAKQAFEAADRSELEKNQKELAEANNNEFKLEDLKKDANTAIIEYAKNFVNSEARGEKKEIAQEKFIGYRNAKKGSDNKTAKEVLKKVKNKFDNNAETAQNTLYESSKDFLEMETENLKDELLKIVVKSQDIDQGKKEELQSLINGFERISFSQESEELFQIKNFINRFSHRLNIRKLTARYNKLLQDEIDEIKITMFESHWQIFKEWGEKLFDNIRERMPELNSDLSSAKEHMDFYKDSIEQLEEAQEALQIYINKINHLMEWKSTSKDTADDI